MRFSWKQGKLFIELSHDYITEFAIEFLLRFGCLDDNDLRPNVGCLGSLFVETKQRFY